MKTKVLASRSTRSALPVAAAMLLAACLKPYTFAATTGVAYPPKPEDCLLFVVDEWPYAGYGQIGVVESGTRVRSRGEFYRAIQNQVCQAGGDVVVCQINGDGYYLRGIVLRKMDAPGVMPQPYVPPGPATAPSTAPAPATLPGTQA